MTDNSGGSADQLQQTSRRGPFVDLLVTLLLWTYFTLGFVVFFAPFYLLATLVGPYRMGLFQTLNHYFYRIFFFLCRLLMPNVTWEIDPAIRRIRSSVMVCNHLSYIDAILLISLCRRHTTIVKERLFHIPVFSTIIKFSGYIPSTNAGDPSNMMARRLNELCPELSQGVNLIVFPEGTRSRSGAIGTFNSGAFKIARLCRAPIEVLYIRHSDKLFKPGHFRFNTQSRHTITLKSVGRLEPDYDRPGFSLAALVEQARDMMVAESGT